MTGGKRKGAGRPPGTTRGKKERISIAISKEHKAWLENKDLSYAKTIAKLIDLVRLAGGA
jgi:hypothetical protein